MRRDQPQHCRNSNDEGAKADLRAHASREMAGGSRPFISNRWSESPSIQ
jgi:hypothetical protein